MLDIMALCHLGGSHAGVTGQAEEADAEDEGDEPPFPDDDEDDDDEESCAAAVEGCGECTPGGGPRLQLSPWGLCAPRLMTGWAWKHSG